MEDNNEELEEVVRETEAPEETSVENLEEVDTNEVANDSVEKSQEQSTEDDLDKKIEERANALFEEKVQKRLARDRASRERKYNKELSKYKQLESIISAGMGVDSVDDAIDKASAFYKEQGIDIPEFRDAEAEKRERRLAKLEAEDIIEMGRQEMEEEANRLAKIPIEQMSTHDKVVFDTICERLTEEDQTQALKAKGIDPAILKDESFKKFKDQFNLATPITDIYDIYQLKGKSVEKPASAGSVKSENTVNSSSLTLEKIAKMTPQEMAKYWDNPEFKRLVGI